MTHRASLIPTAEPGARARTGAGFNSLGLVLLTLTLIWAGFAAFAWNERQVTQAEVQRDTGNLARGFAEHVNRTIEDVEQLMLLLRAAYAADPTQINLAHWAAPRSFHNELTLQIAIIGPDGMLRDSNLGLPAKPVDLSDRPHFRAQRDSARDDLYISVPVLGRVSGHRTIQLTRKLFNAQGGFAGVLVVSLDTATLAAFYDSIDIGAGEILLIGTDGVVRARGPISDQGLGRQIAGTSLAAMLQPDPRPGQLQGARLIHAASPIDGVARIYGFRRLANYPLLVAVGEAQADVNGPPTRRIAMAAAVAVGVSLLVLLVGRALLRREAGLQRAQQVLASKNDALRDSAARLHLSEQQLRRFIETAPVELAMFDRDGRIIAVSDTYRRAKLGDWPSSAVVGRLIDELRPAMDARWAERRRRSLEGEVLSSDAESFTDAKGVVSWQRWELRPWFTGSGAIGGLVYFTEDITDRIETEAALRQSQKLEALGRLTGGVAHDFNNLLAVVMMNADMLADALGDQPELAGLAESILGSARSGADLTQRLLAYARRQTLQPKVIDLAAFLHEQLVMLRRAIGEAITVEAAIAPGLAAVEVDPSQVADALLNLAINARDAMPEGGRLTIAARNRVLTAADNLGLQDAHTGPHVEITVTDTGFGMAPEVLAHATDPFFTTKQVGEGSGLGLSMVDGFVRQSGGHMAIVSAPGQGTRVSLFLPQARALARPAEAAPAEAGDLAGHERVLVVDDNDEVRHAVSRMLESLGYRVSEAASGRLALAELERAGPPDLLLADIVMPDGMSGLQLAEAARDRWPQLRVLFASGFLPSDSDGPQPVPARHLLRKPFSRRMLAESVRAVLDSPVTVP
jgi:PAS domain S-box-containing protein